MCLKHDCMFSTITIQISWRMTSVWKKRNVKRAVWPFGHIALYLQWWTIWTIQEEYNLIENTDNVSLGTPFDGVTQKQNHFFSYWRSRKGNSIPSLAISLFHASKLRFCTDGFCKKKQQPKQQKNTTKQNKKAWFQEKVTYIFSKKKKKWSTVNSKREPGIKDINKTRMHSSRMRTTCSLTVSHCIWKKLKKPHTPPE